MPSFLPHRYTPRRPWQRMSDAEWLALMPYILRRSGPGRPIRELRQRMDGIFHLACTPDPWRSLPAEFGKPDTVSRYFRRLTHAGLWDKLLADLAEADPSHPLRAIEAWICRACRRAVRLLGIAFIVRIRRLGLRSALPGPPWLLPDPDLSETLLRVPIELPERPDRAAFRALHAKVRSLVRCLTVSIGRRSIPRAVRFAWA